MGRLTPGEIARLTTLCGEHRVIGARDGSPVAERPDGRPACAAPDGRLAATTLVSRVQSYLHVERC
ncbi:MAG: hypothetical protein ABSG93_08450 [Solirubrobacteraceae bacterium]|jgi:hypothetical protein